MTIRQNRESFMVTSKHILLIPFTVKHYHVMIDS